MTIAENINDVRPAAASKTHNITFTLNSDLTVTAAPNALTVNEGDNVEVALVWPSNWGTSCTCTLAFTSGQDPFNDTITGSTVFTVSDGVKTMLPVNQDAEIETDIYTVTMTVGTHTGSLDPQIKVGGGPTNNN